ncbi:ubiquitin-specific protease ubp15 [Blastocladiella emersonii ATCC 22665]|nr:ubiquitin-specific protease ubp15 [Blastocladiella emersonii ATCC 22665]
MSTDGPPSPDMSPRAAQTAPPSYDEIDTLPASQLTQPLPADAASDASAAVVTLHERARKHFEEQGRDFKVVSETELRWSVESWTDLRKEGKVLSEPTDCSGHKWRILLFPNGNGSDRLSMYLQLDWPEKKQDEAVCADFVLGIAHPDDPATFHCQWSSHRFGEIELDWGFGNFVPLAELPKYVVNDRTELVAFVRILHDETGVMFHSFKDYDSKRFTGFVGLRNQGATCYMNSILQSLYCTNYFRRAVYQIPLPPGDGGASDNRSVTGALQRLFYFMQTQDDAVETNELTKSFGWNTADAFAQHDVQEFLRVLCDNLEEKMKGTPADGMIPWLFVGKMTSYIKCVNVDYESSRIEDFYDIQLNVKGMKTVQDSFRDYIQVETLEGDNKYMAEGHGLQDAKKGVVFTKFPPVLHLQLKRFEYDFMRDAMVKINDRYEFPLVLELDDFLTDDGYDQADAAAPVSHKYHLHGVLVHSGSVDAGHYCAFVRPSRANKWFKFDDDKVIPVTQKEVTEDNFGGEYPVPPGTRTMNRLGASRGIIHKRFTNAYMLVYIRESDYDKVLCDVTEGDVPSAILEQLERERLEREEKERVIREREFMLTVRIIDDATIRPHADFDLWSFSPTSSEWQQRFNKLETTWRDVHITYAQHLGVAPDQLRFWALTGRENKTPVKIKSTWKDEELMDGDILAVQVETPAADAVGANPGWVRTVPEYYDFLVNKIDVVFKPKSQAAARDSPVTSPAASGSTDIRLTMSKKTAYDDVATILARSLGVGDPHKLRLTSTFIANEAPRSVIRRGPNVTLSEMLGTNHFSPAFMSRHATGIAGVILYEVLSMSLTELESKRVLKMTCLVPGKEETVEIMVPKSSTTADLATAVAEKLAIAPADRIRLRLFETFGSRITREFSGTEQLNMIPEYSTIVAQLLPATDRAPAHTLTVTHIARLPTAAHGTPFKFPLLDKEPFGQTKARLQLYLGYSDKEMSKVTVRIMTVGSILDSETREVAEDDDLSQLLLLSPALAVAAPSPDPAAGPEVATTPSAISFNTTLGLALDHPQRRASRLVAGLEKAVKIFN